MTVTYTARPAEVSSTEPPRRAAPSRRRRRVPRGVRKLAGPVLLVAIWSVLSATSTVSDQVLPSPWAVADAGWQLARSGELWSNLSVSLVRVAEGLAFGVTIGTALAVAAGLSQLGEDLLDSSMQVLKSVPAFALVPLLIMWFGIDDTPRVLLIVLGTSVPVYINTFSAIRNVDRDLVEAAQAFGAGRWRLITQVILPGSLPGFLVGLRFALTGAWLSLVFAETINVNKGLGYLMQQAETLLETDVMVFTVVVYAVIGLLSYALLRLLERHLLSWRRGYEGSR